jgi:phospholipid/cholesterol/gamma-HCH transport system substrate-binding protein
MTPGRERVLVGLFVVIAATVMAVTTVAVWGGLGRDGVSYRAYFKFSGGVQPGTAVRYGGLRVGRVQTVRVDPVDSTRIEVNLTVDPGTPIKIDSVARPSSLGPLSDNYVEITTGSQGAAVAAPGSVLNSAEPFGLAQIGDTVQSLIPQIETVLDKLTLNLDQLHTTLGRADGLMSDRNRENLGQALARANDLLNDSNRAKFSDSLDRANQMLKDTGPQLSRSLSNLGDATGRLNPLIDDVTKTSVHANELLSRFDSLLSENRGDLRAAVTELREVLAKSGVAVNQLQEIMNKNTVNIDSALEDLRQSTENIRSLTDAVKSNPATLIRGVKATDRKPGEIRK